MRKECHKLIRDRIPEIIRQSGKHFDVAILNVADYQQALRQKLMEEAQKVAIASEADLVTELADLYEVIEALMSTSGIGEETVRQVQAKRRDERGGFTRRLLLLWTEDTPPE
jgi:predicted house-cleaning noncanonical NTP pyrophosphatase (MazG superfamily)